MTDHKTERIKINSITEYQAYYQVGGVFIITRIITSGGVPVI